MYTASELIGGVATVLLTVASLPQVYKMWRSRDVRGVSITMLYCWGIGMGLMLLHLVLEKVTSIPLYTNYVLNGSFVVLMIYFYHTAKQK